MFKKRIIFPDLLYNSLEISKFINIIMISGKKYIARNIFYKALNYIKIFLKKDPLQYFFSAIDNIGPLMEIKNKKYITGNNNISIEIKNFRRINLSMKWFKDSIRIRKEKYIYLKIANEIIEAYSRKGKIINKKKIIYKISESNRIYNKK